MKRSMNVAGLTALAAVLVLVAMVAVTACSSGTSGGGSGSTAGSVTVSLQNLSIDPSTIDVPAGGSVVFVNNDTTTHDIVGPNFDTGALAPGASSTQAFPTAGTYAIHCSIHPQMTASVVVK